MEIRNVLVAGLRFTHNSPEKYPKEILAQPSMDGTKARSWFLRENDSVESWDVK